MGGDGNKPSGNLLSTVKMEIFTKFISSSWREVVINFRQMMDGQWLLASAARPTL